MGISLPDDIGEYLGVVEGGIEVEEYLDGCYPPLLGGLVQEHQQEPACEHPLHHYRVQHEPVSYAHAYFLLVSDADDHEPDKGHQAPISPQHEEVKPHQAVGEELEVEQPAEGAQAGS